mmetsp:Transcript_7764/g.12028  ORF Transcript_7764/g.12028 Transcript_7764/m.12028 type:complete len:308 (-) Transcript_7764:740-1663(-)
MNFPVTSDGITPLMLACSFGNKIITQVIMKNKITDREVQDNQGWNSLFYGTFYNRPAIVEELGRREVPYVVSKQGLTCLHTAAEKGHLEIIDLFLNYKEKHKEDWKANHPWDNKIDVNARKIHKSGLGASPAFLAAKKGHLEVFKLLHQHDAQIEGSKFSMGENSDLECIHIAAKQGHHEIVLYILSKSTDMQKIAKIRIKNTYSSPIHLAAYQGKFEVAKVLIEAGAPVFAKNRLNDTVFHIAIRHGQTRFVKDLLKFLSENPMYTASEKQARKHIFDMENQEKCSPYTLAVLREHFDVADWLLEE